MEHLSFFILPETSCHQNAPCYRKYTKTRHLKKKKKKERKKKKKKKKGGIRKMKRKDCIGPTWPNKLIWWVDLFFL